MIRDEYTEQCLSLFLFLFHDCSHVGVGVVGDVGGVGGVGGGGGGGIAVNKKEDVVEEKSPSQILLL